MYTLNQATHYAVSVQEIFSLRCSSGCTNYEHHARLIFKHHVTTTDD